MNSLRVDRRDTRRNERPLVHSFVLTPFIRRENKFFIDMAFLFRPRSSFGQHWQLIVKLFAIFYRLFGEAQIREKNANGIPNSSVGLVIGLGTGYCGYYWQPSSSSSRIFFRGGIFIQQLHESLCERRFSPISYIVLSMTSDSRWKLSLHCPR